MSINATEILSRVVSHAMTLGRFERVNQHEPKNAPGKGLSASVWMDSIAPARGGSGLSKTTGRLVLNVRLYSSFIMEPQDAIDPELLTACDELLAAYSGDFELGGTVKQIDLMGQYGTPLSAQAGYLNQDGMMFRVMTITLPVIVNDLWEQVP